MLLNFESNIYTQQITSLLSVKYLWNFTCKDSDIQCLRYIINLVVQAALT